MSNVFHICIASLANEEFYSTEEDSFTILRQNILARDTTDVFFSLNIKDEVKWNSDVINNCVSMRNNKRTLPFRFPFPRLNIAIAFRLHI